MTVSRFGFWMATILSIFSVFIFPSASKSQSLVGAAEMSGMCGVVIALEMYAERLIYDPTIVEIERSYWVVETDSGAFAAIIGYVEDSRSQQAITDLKAEGTIPEDSFCMGFDHVIGVTGLGNPEPIEKLAATSALPDEELSTDASTAWYAGETLEWEANIGQWIATSDDVRLRTAAYYISGLIRSDDQLRSLIASGQFLQISERAVECANELSIFSLNTGQKSSSDRISDIVVVCAGMNN